MAEVNNEVVDTIISLALHSEIVHHIPGRIRLRVLPTGYHLALKLNVRQLMQCIPGIVDVRINPAVRSVVIEYDRNILPFPLWRNVGNINRRAELSAELHAVLQNITSDCRTGQESTG